MAVIFLAGFVAWLKISWVPDKVGTIETPTKKSYEFFYTVTKFGGNLGLALEWKGGPSVPAEVFQRCRRTDLKLSERDLDAELGCINIWDLGDSPWKVFDHKNGELLQSGDLRYTLSQTSGFLKLGAVKNVYFGQKLRVEFYPSSNIDSDTPRRECKVLFTK